MTTVARHIASAPEAAQAPVPADTVAQVGGAAVHGAEQSIPYEVAYDRELAVMGDLHHRERFTRLAAKNERAAREHTAARDEALRDLARRRQAGSAVLAWTAKVRANLHDSRAHRAGLLAQMYGSNPEVDLKTPRAKIR